MNPPGNSGKFGTPSVSMVTRAPFVGASPNPQIIKEMPLKQRPLALLETPTEAAGGFPVNINYYKPWKNDFFQLTPEKASLLKLSNQWGHLAKENELSQSTIMEFLFLSAKGLIDPPKVMDRFKSYVKYADKALAEGFVLSPTFWAFLFEYADDASEIYEWDKASEIFSKIKHENAADLKTWNDAMMDSASCVDGMISLHFDPDTPFNKYSNQDILQRDAPLVTNCALSSVFPLWQLPILTIAVANAPQAIYVSSLFTQGKLSAFCRSNAPFNSVLKIIFVPFYYGIDMSITLEPFLKNHMFKEEDSE